MNRNITALFSLLLLSNFIVNPVVAAGYFGAGIGSASMEGTDDSSIKFFGGNRQDNVGFEVAYHDLGKQEESAFGLTAAIEVTGLEFSGVGFMNVSSVFDLFGKIGLLLWDADVSLTGFPSVSVDGSDLIFGLGAQFNPSNNASIRFEFQTTTLDFNGIDLDVDVISIGAAFNF